MTAPVDQLPFANPMAMSDSVPERLDGASAAEKNHSSSEDNPGSGSSLLPMLVTGLVLIVLGMIGALAFS